MRSTEKTVADALKNPVESILKPIRGWVLSAPKTVRTLVLLSWTTDDIVQTAFLDVYASLGRMNPGRVVCRSFIVKLADFRLRDRSLKIFGRGGVDSRMARALIRGASPVDDSLAHYKERRSAKELAEFIAVLFADIGIPPGISSAAVKVWTGEASLSSQAYILGIKPKALSAALLRARRAIRARYTRAEFWDLLRQ